MDARLEEKAVLGPSGPLPVDDVVDQSGLEDRTLLALLGDQAHQLALHLQHLLHHHHLHHALPLFLPRFTTQVHLFAARTLALVADLQSRVQQQLQPLTLHFPHKSQHDHFVDALTTSFAIPIRLHFNQILN